MDDDNMIPIVSREMLVKTGTSAITSIAGGALLMLMTMGARFRLPGIVLSAASLIIGISALFSGDKDDKKPGLVLTIAGALGMVIQFGIPITKPFAVFILGLTSMSLFASGIWKGIKFLIGLRSRR